MEPTELAIVRRAFAKQVLAVAAVRDPRIEAALAAIAREDFLDPGPWNVFRWPVGRYFPTPDDDPVYVYTNDPIAICAERQINNGAPSYHASMLAQARPAAGEHLVHVGTGTGYYTAIMAQLAGPSGRVTGIEYEPDLAERAAKNLAAHPNVRVMQGDGSLIDFDTADVIYVNAGATRPADIWLDRLADGGRLILPLTTEKGVSKAFNRINTGVVFRIERHGEAYTAAWISDVAVFPCAGSRDEASEQALATALQNGKAKNVTRLYRGEPPPDDECWLRAPGWSLCYS